ncbi:hypothetical protein H181DRAFT_04235 [Streptomyces sp. WMMB 714]|nr:hypothetical protein H181DRAFT_04235 [Streptomyces sp. WMMB 714]
MSARSTRGAGSRYGASPLHLLLVLASFALTGYAGVRLLQGDVLGIVVWFAGSALLHDLLLLPLYTAADRALQALARRRHARRGPHAADGRHAGDERHAADERGRADHGRGQVNYVRVPAFVSLVLLLVWYPLVLGRVHHYTAYTGLDAGVFWGRWLLITAALFVLSALCLAVRTLRPRRRRAGSGTA